MLTAILFGLAASSALVLGAGIGSCWNPPKIVSGALLAFAGGALISALSFELFEEAYELGGATRSGLALLAGAAVFIAIDTALDRRTATSGAASTGAAGWALLAGVTLDGVPENLALGVSLAHGSSAALLLAIFVSNFPEALVGAVSMREAHRSRSAVLGTWMACALLLAAAVVAGRAMADPLGDEALSVALGFAGGAVLASLADTLMPKAFEQGGPLVAFATAAGFFLSFVLAV